MRKSILVYRHNGNHQQMNQIRISLGTSLIAVVLAMFGGYRWGYHVTNAQKEKIVQEDFQSTQNCQRQIETNKKLAEHLKNIENKNVELAKKLSIYEKLTQNDTQNNSVKIKTFQIFSTNQPNTFRYDFVLTKETVDSEVVKGQLNMTIVGKIEERSFNLPVKFVDSSSEECMQFSFRHFQELSGEITLPSRFTPQSVHFSLKHDKSDNQDEEALAWKVIT